MPTYPVLSVFDISQTDPIEGHPQPEPIARRLEGEDTAAILDRVRDLMTGQGWTRVTHSGGGGLIVGREASGGPPGVSGWGTT